MEITPYYLKKINCLHCNHSFHTTRVRSRFVRVSSHDSDFKPNYTDESINPTYYNVAVCPDCGFSFTDEFSPYFAPDTKEAIQSQISSKWKPRSFEGERDASEAIECYKLAYLSAIIKKEKAIAIAGLALRIAWIYRQLENIEDEKRFISISRNAYIESYSESDFSGTQMSEERVIYLIAELSRRIGDKEEAVRNFSRVIERQRTTMDPKIIDMAKERWQEMREADEIKKGLSS